MKRVYLITGWGLAVSLFTGVASAADQATTPARNATENPAAAPPRKPLDLRVGDIRKYMTPEEFRALSVLPEDSTVIVQADAPLVPMKSKLDVPGGILAPFWALANPTQAWRLFLPDPRVNIKNIPPPDSKIPPPVFRWGP